MTLVMRTPEGGASRHAASVVPNRAFERTGHRRCGWLSANPMAATSPPSPMFSFLALQLFQWLK
jgi:hypothetical protein